MNNSGRRTFKNNPLLKAMSSIKITVICLFLLFILTFWGTLAQVNHGLYQSQEKFFYSWYFLVFDFVPFPAARLVLWVLFVNLISVTITRFVFRWSQIGILIIHLGLLSYFLAAFVIFHSTVESNVTLLEGEATNLSSAYFHWELSVWEENDGNYRDISAYDSDSFKPGQLLDFSPLPFTVQIDTYFKNASAYIEKNLPTSAAVPLNDSGITTLIAQPIAIEPEKNQPGATVTVTTTDNKISKLLLYGGDSQPTRIVVNGKKFQFQLRRKKYPLPFIIQLKLFEKTMHPGTEIAREYKSLVEINHQGVSREVLIWMNNPLRYKNITAYQASYSVDALGRERSTLAVVKNSGRMLPYISSLLTFFGLALHFLAMAFTKKFR